LWDTYGSTVTTSKIWVLTWKYHCHKT